MLPGSLWAPEARPPSRTGERAPRVLSTGSGSQDAVLGPSLSSPEFSAQPNSRAQPGRRRCSSWSGPCLGHSERVGSAARGRPQRGARGVAASSSRRPRVTRGTESIQRPCCSRGQDCEWPQGKRSKQTSSDLLQENEVLAEKVSAIAAGLPWSRTCGKRPGKSTLLLGPRREEGSWCE